MPGLDDEVTGTKAVMGGGLKLPCLLKVHFTPLKLREKESRFLISGMYGF